MPSDDHVRRVWTLGSYPDIGRNFLSMAARLVDAAGVEPTQRVLDVACGTGNVAITAARRGAQVTGLDITPSMLDDARENARIAGVEAIEWEEGDATDLPFADDAFDVTLSCVGHMFAQPPDEAAAELLRVTKPGGTVAFTSWTPESVVPAMARALQEYLPPNLNARPPPFEWGDPAIVRERLGDGAADVEFETGTVNTRALSPAHFWEDARTQSGMFIVALENVDDENLPALRDDSIDAITHFFDDNTNTVAMAYRLTTARVE